MNLAWSTEREAQLRRRITAAWSLMWCFFISGLMALAASYIVHWLLVVAGSLLGVAVYTLLQVNQLNQQLGSEARMTHAGFSAGSGMLANKPRSTANLTKWVHHLGPYDPGQRFVCPCGLPYFWSDAQWIPNVPPGQEQEDAVDVDPGGGRYVLLCRCGIGHFKLRDSVRAAGK